MAAPAMKMTAKTTTQAFLMAYLTSVSWAGYGLMASFDYPSTPAAPLTFSPSFLSSTVVICDVKWKHLLTQSFHGYLQSEGAKEVVNTQAMLAHRMFAIRRRFAQTIAPTIFPVKFVYSSSR